MKTGFFLTIFILGTFSMYAQDIEVKKFNLLEKDYTATLSARRDLNGNTCGLVKVLLKEPGAEFEGSVMGDVQFTGSEYLVYLPNGTKRMGIKHPDYLPTTIVFADYGTKKIESGVTYQLKLKANKKPVKVDKSKKGIAVFNIKPSNAMLLIDGQIADGSGGAYTLSLPFGTHYYTVKLKDFSLTNQSVKIDKEAKTIDVDLTEYYAQLEVKCETADADIYINEEPKGVGNLKTLIVPGKCIIEVHKEGYYAMSKTIELSDNDTCIVNMPQMQPIVGTLVVSNKLQECEVLLDGELMGKTPFKKTLPIGDYQLEIRRELYHSYKSQITINEDQTLNINEELVQTQLGKIVESAEQGNSYGICLLAGLYLHGTEDALKKDEGWGIFCGENPGDAPVYFANRDIAIEEIKEGYFIRKDIEKADYWVRKAYAPGFHREAYTWFDFESLTEQLMICYLTGDGITQDFDKSFYWLSKYSAPYPYKYIEAWHYYYGKGVRKDESKALELINDACRWFDYSHFVPYTACNPNLLKKILQPIAAHYQWDERLIRFFENN